MGAIGKRGIVGIENPKFRSVGWAWRILQAEAGARKLR
jgi:hypothetical protein